MARPLQKKKNKSSLPRVRQKPKSKRINIKSNPIVAANWDQSLTLSQNYRKLGLSSKLNAHTGGTEVKGAHPEGVKKPSGLIIPSSRRPRTLGTAEIKVTRDPKTGAIVSVEEDGRQRRARENPLNDPLNSDSGSDADEDGHDEEEVGKSRGIVPELEEAATYSKKKRPRMQSEREQEWVQDLVKKHGENWGAMVRDRRLNPQQQSEGDIKRRVELWKKMKRRVDAGDDDEGSK
ncbi:nucleolar protein 16, partial [Lecanoromycetidae sp. Uapishka_2]